MVFATKFRILSGYSKRSPGNNMSSKIFSQALWRSSSWNKIGHDLGPFSTSQKTVLSSSRGHGIFEDLQVLRPRIRTWPSRQRNSNCVIETVLDVLKAKDVLEDSISASKSFKMVSSALIFSELKRRGRKATGGPFTSTICSQECRFCKVRVEEVSSGNRPIMPKQELVEYSILCKVGRECWSSEWRMVTDLEAISIENCS